MGQRALLALVIGILGLGCSSTGRVANPHGSFDTTIKTHAQAFSDNPTGCSSCHGPTSNPAQRGGPADMSCSFCHTPDPHSTGASCISCHSIQQNQWSSSSNLHAASAADVLTNPDHNSSELLIDACVKCHSSFQVPLGVAHFVTPLNQVGPWTALNQGDWQATKCEVCHDPSSTDPCKLAKYGSLLDGPWSAGYTKISDLPSAYQMVIGSAGAFTQSTYPDQTSLTLRATKLCNSCHDPADQGGDPDIILGGIDYGPQGGDSRAYVTTSHRGLGCIDCHPTHDFTPIRPETKPSSCGGSGCHGIDRSGSLPGAVHVNHL